MEHPDRDPVCNLDDDDADVRDKMQTHDMEHPDRDPVCNLDDDDDADDVEDDDDVEDAK